MLLKEVMFYIFKDGKSEGEVGFLYDDSNYDDKFYELMKRYPESKGYKLCEKYRRTL